MRFGVSVLCAACLCAAVATATNAEDPLSASTSPQPQQLHRTQLALFDNAYTWGPPSVPQLQCRNVFNVEDLFELFGCSYAPQRVTCLLSNRTESVCARLPSPNCDLYHYLVPTWNCSGQDMLYGLGLGDVVLFCATDNFATCFVTFTVVNEDPVLKLSISKLCTAIFAIIMCCVSFCGLVWFGNKFAL